LRAFAKVAMCHARESAAFRLVFPQ